MKQAWGLLKNKFILASVIFVLYALLLDDHDAFSIYTQKRKLKELQAEKARFEKDLLQTRLTLKKLNERSEVEKFAREKKLFKKDNEDVFVIFYE